MRVKLIRCSENPEALITSAAKLCYSPVGIEEIEENLTPESTEKFINFLMSLGHESPLEHVTFSFAVEGVSRVLETQLVRHRIASYSIQSGRYVKRDAPDFVTPKRIAECHEASSIYHKALQATMKAYNELIDTLISWQIDQEGFSHILPSDEKELSKFAEEYPNYYKMFEKNAIEDARYIYPQSLCTKLVCTFNARSFLNFIEHRSCRRAQNEIQQLAWAMLEELKPKLPTLAQYYGPSCMTKGKCSEGRMCCGNPYPSIKKDKKK